MEVDELRRRGIQFRGQGDAGIPQLAFIEVRNGQPSNELIEQYKSRLISFGFDESDIEVDLRAEGGGLSDEPGRVRSIALGRPCAA